jgi:hypothetical protein
MDMVVMRATNYNVILGNNWLEKIEATINFKDKVLQCKDGENTIGHPIIFEKEVQKIILEGDDLYDEEELIQSAAYFLKLAGNEKAPAGIRARIEDAELKDEWREIPTIPVEEKSNLTEKQQQQLNGFIQAYEDRFAEDLLDLGRIKGYEHQIPTTCDRPIKQKPYRHDGKKRKFIREETERMLEAGIAIESYSAWTSPVVVVMKKNGNMRLCVDYRKLNGVTTWDEYPLPLIDDIFDSMTGSPH